MLHWLLIALAAVAATWAAGVLALVVLGRAGQARELVRSLPDCLVLLARVVRDPQVRRSDRLLILATLGYLALPFDVIPDFIPIAGQLDDVIVVALVVHRLRRRLSRELLAAHWPGPPERLETLLRLA